MDEKISIFTLIGIALAAIISYSLWHSIVWATIAGLFGWFYVFYALLTYGNQITF